MAHPARPNIIKPFRGAQIEKAHPLAKGLVGMWLFNEGTGDRVFDLSGNGNDGTLTNMDEADWVPGIDGGALDFDGSNDYVEINSVWDQFQTNDADFTLLLWFRVDDFANAVRLIEIGNGAATSTSPTITGFRLAVGNLAGHSGFNTLIGQIMSGSRASVGLDNAIAEANRWYFAAFTYNGVNKTLYLDGNQIASNTGGSWNTHTVAQVGRQHDNGNFFDGKISDVRIYNRVLSAGEIMSLYRNSYAIFR